jgi:hypothetical protein
MAETTTTEPTMIPISPAVAKARNDSIAIGSDQAQAALEQNRSTDGASLGSYEDQGLHLAGLQKADPHISDSPSSFRINDIQVGKPDGRGVTITHVYAAQSKEYRCSKS